MNAVELVSRVPVTAQDVFRFRGEYIQKRNMIAWSFSNPNNPIELVDIVITHDLGEMKKVTISVGGYPVFTVQ